MTRTGLQQAIRVLVHFCRIYTTYSAKMKSAIDAAPVGTSAEKEAAKIALDAIFIACQALRVFEEFFEP